MTVTVPPPGHPARDPNYFRGMALVVVAGALMSLGGIGVRLIESAGAWQILFYRSLALIATLLVVLAIRNRGGLLGAFRAAGMPAVVAGLCLSIAFSGFIFSLGYTTVANTLFLLAASPCLACWCSAWRCRAPRAARDAVRKSPSTRLGEAAVPVARANRQWSPGRASASLDDAPHRLRLPSCPPPGPTDRPRDLYGPILRTFGISGLRRWRPPIGAV